MTFSIVSEEEDAYPTTGTAEFISFGLLIYKFVSAETVFKDRTTIKRILKLAIVNIPQIISWNAVEFTVLVRIIIVVVYINAIIAGTSKLFRNVRHE